MWLFFVLWILLFQSQSFRLKTYSFHSIKTLKAISKNAPLPKDLGLTEKLAEIVDRFRSTPENTEKYEMLLHYGTLLRPMPEKFKIPENKVLGCQSDVYVHAAFKRSQICFEADADSQLTKGLVTILVHGLSYNSPEDILQVKPDFIKYTGLDVSLSPSRNNGFLNMFETMQDKTEELVKESKSKRKNRKPKLTTLDAKIENELQILQPTKLEIKSISKPNQIGAYFSINIVADCFQEHPSPISREALIYTILQNFREEISGLEIMAKTPTEDATS